MRPAARAGHAAETAESDAGRLFPVGDEAVALGHVDMFRAMEAGEEPQETSCDGCVVAAVLDAFHRSIEARAWAPVELDRRHGLTPKLSARRADARGQGGPEGRAAARTGASGSSSSTPRPGRRRTS